MNARPSKGGSGLAGALLLITDHQPYGSASVALAQHFGIVMNTSGTIDPANTDQKTRGLVFTRESQLVVDHPITIGRDPSERINRVETFYGQAVYGPVGSTGFLRFADTATYESANGEQSAAGWAQGVAVGYGAGRVVVMGEAAELSAQLAGLEPVGMNVPGIDNRQMALNIMHWLSGQFEPRITAVAAGVTERARRCGCSPASFLSAQDAAQELAGINLPVFAPFPGGTGRTRPVSSAIVRRQDQAAGRGLPPIRPATSQPTGRVRPVTPGACYQIGVLHRPIPQRGVRRLWLVTAGRYLAGREFQL